MNVQYSDDIKTSSESYGLAEKATKRLEEVLGDSSDLVSAEWRRTMDENGRPLLALRLKDFTGEVERQIALDELRSPALTSFHLHRLWGDLLQARNEKRLKDLVGTEG